MFRCKIEIDPNEIFKQMDAEYVYMKSDSDGVLYMIKYLLSQRRNVHSIERSIDVIDNILKVSYNSSDTFFLPIAGSRNIDTSRVLSFSRRSHLKNPIYLKMFSFIGSPLQGVRMWKRKNIDMEILSEEVRIASKLQVDGGDGVIVLSVNGCDGPKTVRIPIFKKKRASYKKSTKAEIFLGVPPPVADTSDVSSPPVKDTSDLSSVTSGSISSFSSAGLKKVTVLRDYRSKSRCVNSSIVPVCNFFKNSMVCCLFLYLYFVCFDAA